ncbi:hypothetical protein V5O48_009626 [Marasmius crinis-equi]|uniref:MYND-type domain-containing protein n=1 Tax=Marasmius crinis-equi TaxID=585013 RepID=A0ABR3FBB3_9AGAR
MSAADGLFTKFLSNPPNQIDLNALGGRCEGILDTLEMAAASLLAGDARSPAIVRGLEKHWPRVWRWIHAIGKAVVENPHPLSSGKGIAAARCLTASVANLFLYPIFRPGCDGQESNVLVPLIKATPALLAFTAELWLWTAEVLVDVEPRIPQLLMQTISTLLLNYKTIASNSASRNLKAETECHLFHVLQDERWDLHQTFVQAIIRDIRDPLLESRGPHWTVSFLNFLIIGTRHLRIGKLIRKDAIQWVLLLMETYTSLPVTISTRNERECKMDLMAGCLIFIKTCIKTDVYFFLQALDEGLLLIICKVKDLLRNRDPLMIDEDGSSVNAETVSLLVLEFEEMLWFFTVTVLYCSILVRAVRWIRRIKDLGFNDEEGGPDGYEELEESWNTLKSEVSRSHALKYKTAHIRSILICGDSQCSNMTRGSYTSSRFFRCSRCKTYVYCSRECQKRAWKSEHRPNGDHLSKGIQDGSWARMPSYYDFVFMRQQVIGDMESVLVESIDRVFKQYYKGMDPEGAGVEAKGIVWIDYTVWPPKLTVRSVQHSRQLMDEFKEDYPARIFLDTGPYGGGLGEIEVIATVPWQGLHTVPCPMVVGLLGK